MTNNFSLKPRRGRSWKRLRRIDIVAELEAQFVPDAQIAEHLGLTVPAITAIKMSPEYAAKRTALATGILANYEQFAMQTEEARKDALEDMIPEALSAVRKIVRTPSHQHHAKVILDLLDRNKATSKISRTEANLTVTRDSDLQNKRANELLMILNGEIPENPSITIPESVRELIVIEAEPEPEEMSDPNFGFDIQASD